MRLKDYALATEGDINKVLKLSKLLDVIAELKPELEELCLVVAKFLNALAHEHHIRQSRELLELTLAFSTDIYSSRQYDQQLAIVRVKEAQICAAKLRAKSALEQF